jgi:CO/xanthine dehydrogenase FAD-binding subunit
MGVSLPNQIFSPANFQALFNTWARFPDAVPFAGGIQTIQMQGKRVLNLPRNILSLDKLEELSRITRTERYLEIGTMVKLNEIVNLGKIVPDVLIQCLQSIAGPQIRNLATIGGHICNRSSDLDIAAPMLALDAHYELRTATASRWISAARFSALSDPLIINPQELVTRIRISLEQWDYSLSKKFKALESGEGGGVIVFIIRNQKNILSDLRIVFAGDKVLRDKDTEDLLIGKRLPLDRKDAFAFVERWEAYLASVSPSEAFLQAKLLNFIEASLLSLSD